MRYLKIILLMGTLSIAFASFPKGTTVIGGWGAYSNGKIDPENFCDDCSYLELHPNISYFLRSNLSLDFDLIFVKQNYNGDTYKVMELDISESYYFAKKFYLKIGLIITKNDLGDDGKSLRLGVGYPIALSKRVMFDINYNFVKPIDIEGVFPTASNDDGYSQTGFDFSFRVAL